MNDKKLKHVKTHSHIVRKREVKTFEKCMKSYLTRQKLKTII